MSNAGESLQAFVETDLIRQVELEISKRYHPSDDPTDSPMKNPVHLSIGQEHVPVAVAMAVGEDAHAYGTHRSHAAYLAWGGDLDAMIAELYGKETGCAGGWGGSMHLIDEAAGFMGTSAIVGSSLSYAVGDALAAKLAGSSRTTVAFVGDAVPETGQFWESLNFASLHELNLMVVIENNELATATTRSARQPAGTGLLEPYLIPNDTIYMKRVYLDTFSGIYKAAYEMTVESKGVKVLWVDTFRMAEHVGPNYDLSSHDRLTEIEMEAANYWSLSELDNARRINAEKIANAFTLAELAPKPTKMWAELGAPIE